MSSSEGLFRANIVFYFDDCASIMFMRNEVDFEFGGNRLADCPSQCGSNTADDKRVAGGERSK